MENYRFPPVPPGENPPTPTNTPAGTPARTNPQHTPASSTSAASPTGTSPFGTLPLQPQAHHSPSSPIHTHRRTPATPNLPPDILAEIATFHTQDLPARTPAPRQSSHLPPTRSAPAPHRAERLLEERHRLAQVNMMANREVVMPTEGEREGGEAEVQIQWVDPARRAVWERRGHREGGRTV